MHAGRLQKALGLLKQATTEVDAALEELRSERDPLALHIFVSRRNYRRTPDSKSGKRQQRDAESSYSEACKLGFRGQFSEWERLMGASASR
jgi:hypothetical protein